MSRTSTSGARTDTRSERPDPRSRCTVLINGICHRALRCILCFMLYAPPGLCFGLCFTPSVHRGPACAHNVGRTAFFSPANHIALPCRTLCLRFLSPRALAEKRFFTARKIGRHRPRCSRRVVTREYFPVFIREIIPAPPPRPRSPFGRAGVARNGSCSLLPL